MKDGYIKLRRGLLEHLSLIPDKALKVYLYLLLNAKFKGKDAGTLKRPYKDICADLDISYPSLQRAISYLNKYYIQVKPAANHHCISEFTIIKYDATSESTHITGDATNPSSDIKYPSTDIKGDASSESLTHNFDASSESVNHTSSNDSKNLQPPYKDKKEKKDKKGIEAPLPSLKTKNGIKVLIEKPDWKSNVREIKKITESLES